MSKYHNFMQKPLSRREMLTICKGGFGSLAFMSLFGATTFSCSRSKNTALNSGSDLLLGPHHLPKAKNVIFLYMDGGVSQVDSFDPKPRLAKENGQDPRKKFKVDATQFDNVGKILKSPWDF